MWVEDLTIALRTEAPPAPAAANRFRVPITLISWRPLPDTVIELVSRKVWTMVSTWVARTLPRTWFHYVLLIRPRRSRIGWRATLREWITESSDESGVATANAFEDISLAPRESSGLLEFSLDPVFDTIPRKLPRDL